MSKPSRTHPNVASLIAGTVWAVSPDKLEQIGALLDRMGPEAASVEADESTEWETGHMQPITYDRGIATVPVDGVMMRRANQMMKISGGTSTDILSKTLRSLAVDDSVRGIVLRINSPGGTVDGISTVAAAVEYAASLKPLAALADSSALSGGMWLGSTAPRFYATEDALLGSIGVISKRLDVSAAMAAAGVREHIFRAGQYKALGQQSEAISNDEVAEEQRMLDNYYGLFVNHVARHRGLSVEDVVATQARVYGATEALALNLINDVKTYEAVVEEINAQAEAGEKLVLAQSEMSAGFSARDTEISNLRAEKAALEGRLEAADTAKAQLEVTAKTAKVDAAVKQLVDEEQKVPPGATDDLRARLLADFDGTMSAMSLIPAKVAAPASAALVLGTAASEETSESVRADAIKRGVPVVETKGGASVYASAGMEYVDATGETAVLVPARAKK